MQNLPSLPDPDQGGDVQCVLSLKRRSHLTLTREGMYSTESEASEPPEPRNRICSAVTARNGRRHRLIKN